MDFIKKCLTITIAACLSFATTISVSAQSGTVTADKLNIRSSTSTSSQIIAHAYMGDELEIIASDGVWYKVSLPNGQTGFASAEYLTPNAAYYGVVTASSLYVRISTGTDSAAVTSLPYGTVVELLAYDGAWYKIQYNNGKTGYVSAEYISLDLSLAIEKPYVVYGYTVASKLNIRESTDTNSQIITKLPVNTCVEILAYDGAWYKIKTPGGIEGYASVAYISMNPVDSWTASDAPENEPTESSVTVADKTASSVPPVTTPPTDEELKLGQDIVQSAYQYIGSPYVWAAAGPDSFDCSGFTMYIMSLHGILLPHQSGMQYNRGLSVPRDSLVPGDLVFFSSNKTSGVAHVGIYIGNGNFIHASSGSSMSVIISPLSANYYAQHYLGARRVI